MSSINHWNSAVKCFRSVWAHPMAEIKKKAWAGAPLHLFRQEFKLFSRFHYVEINVMIINKMIPSFFTKKWNFDIVGNSVFSKFYLATKGPPVRVNKAIEYPKQILPDSSWLCFNIKTKHSNSDCYHSIWRRKANGV